MELDTIKSGIDRMMGAFLRGGEFDVHWACEVLSAARKHLDEPPGDEPVSADDGFAILSMPRYEALREAEESLQEMRFEPADGDAEDEKQATIDVLTRENARLKGVMNSWEVLVRIKAGEISKLRAEIERWRDVCDRLKAQCAPLAGVDQIPRDDEVFLKHVQDLQSEIEGIKARLDEGCGQFSKLNARLDEQSDRLHGFIARMNRLDADVMPIRQIGPGTGPLREPILGPDARKTVEEAKTRLLKEAFERGAGRVESTKT